MKDDSIIEMLVEFFIWMLLISSICTFVYFITKPWHPKYEHSSEKEGYRVIEYSKACIDDKEFILHIKGITINLDMDGKPIPCNLKE